MKHRNPRGKPTLTISWTSEQFSVKAMRLLCGTVCGETVYLKSMYEPPNPFTIIILEECKPMASFLFQLLFHEGVLFRCFFLDFILTKFLKTGWGPPRQRCRTSTKAQTYGFKLHRLRRTSCFKFQTAQLLLNCWPLKWSDTASSSHHQRVKFYFRIG